MMVDVDGSLTMWLTRSLANGWCVSSHIETRLMECPLVFFDFDFDVSFRFFLFFVKRGAYFHDGTGSDETCGWHHSFFVGYFVWLVVLRERFLIYIYIVEHFDIRIISLYFDFITNVGSCLLQIKLDKMFLISHFRSVTAAAIPKYPFFSTKKTNIIDVITKPYLSCQQY